jgi:hypothetical protein
VVSPSKLWLTLILILALGCATGTRVRGAYWAYTVLVVNENSGPVKIGDAMGPLGRVESGRVGCFELRQPNQRQRLWWKYTAEQKNYTVEFTPNEWRGWKWIIGHSAMQTRNDLWPSKRCEP